MEAAVLNTIARYGLLSPGDRVAVAVSGGPDSTCLLHLLWKLRASLDIKIFVVHVNHLLRPEAGREAEHVKRFALELCLPYAGYRVNVPALKARGGDSVQNAARKARYRCLLEAARRFGCQKLALAHHLDDRVETMLWRLLSGGGLDGLAGIPVKRAIDDSLTVIRPLFEVARRDILAYCSQNNLPTVLDRSNLDTHYLRNKVRMELIPFLEKEFGPSVPSALARCVNHLSADRELLEKVVEQAFSSCVTARGKTLTVHLARLREMSQELQKRVIRRALWQSGVERVTLAHVNEVLEIAGSQSPSSTVHLPNRVQARRNYDELTIGRVTPAAVTGSREEFFLKIPGVTALPWGGEIEAELVPNAPGLVPTVSRREAVLDAGKVSRPVTVRTRREGDRFRPLNARGSKKLKDILIDRKIPRGKRDLLPVLLCGNNIIWVGGVEIAHHCRVTNDTKQVLRLKWNLKEGNEDYFRQ